MILADQSGLLRARLRMLTWVVIAGLILSGLTAMPLPQEVEWLARVCGMPDSPSPGGSGALITWLGKVRSALQIMDALCPFVFYGGDWLAFGHFMIALSFVGPLRDPVRNVWVYDFGMMACVLVIPFAMIMGQVRGIPVFWRLIDCAFGAGGFVPMWYCRRYARELATLEIRLPTTP